MEVEVVLVVSRGGEGGREGGLQRERERTRREACIGHGHICRERRGGVRWGWRVDGGWGGGGGGGVRGGSWNSALP